MYKIFADDTLIYDSTLEDLKICKGSISLELNKSGSFTFSVYPEHFYYENFVLLKTVITVYKSGKIVFRGRMLNNVIDHWNNKVITCEGELGFLQDSIIRPFTFIGYPEDLLKAWIEDHNSQVDEFKQFKVGKVTVVEKSKGYVECTESGYKSTYTNITDYLVNKLGGYLYITHGEDGTDPVPTINYLADFEKISTQTIEFGVNLKNYTKTVKAEEIATAIIPLGAEIEEETDEEDDAVERTARKLTIESVNDGQDYIFNAAGVAMYGWVVKVVEWEDISSAIELKRTAEEYLNEIVGQKNTLELNAVDLHLLDPTIESISIGEYIRALSTPHNMDVTLLCSGQNMDLLKPENDSFTLGCSYRDLSDLSSDIIKNITSNYITNKRFTREFSKTSTLIEQTEESIKLEVAGIYAKQTELESLETRTLSQIAMQTDSILLSVSGEYVTRTAFATYQDRVESKLELKVGKDENDKIISMINASADQITLDSNRLIINSDYLQMSADGTLTVLRGVIGDCELVDGKFVAKRLQAVKGEGEQDYDVSLDSRGLWVYRDELGSGTFVGGHIEIWTNGIGGGSLGLDAEKIVWDNEVTLTKDDVIALKNLI